MSKQDDLFENFLAKNKKSNERFERICHGNMSED
jgi:hypothetical protein